MYKRQAYRTLGFDIADYPNAYRQYCCEITLPLHTKLSDDDVDYVVASFKRALIEADSRVLQESD